MRTEQFSFTGFEQTPLQAMLWLPEGRIRCILQITHGMTEHMGRYIPLAQTLTDQGVAVAGFDLRGHGTNPGGTTAVFAEGDWERSIQDMHCFFRLLNRRFPEVSHFLHGFSLGSFLVRDYLSRYPEGIRGALILGTGDQPAWLLGLIRSVVGREIRNVGYEKGSPLVRRLSFGAYNQKFKTNRTTLDWLCADEVQLDQYLADPLCREEISAGLFYQMLEAMARTGKKNACRNWNRSMPVLLLSGWEDPVGGMGKGVLLVKKQLEKAGMEKIQLHLIPHARHMVLREEGGGGAEEGRRILLSFLLEHC